MNSAGKRTRRSQQRGDSLIEFAFVALLLFTIIFASFEICRLLLVYTTVANSARIGQRYAIVHGSTAGCASNDTITNVVKDYAKVGLLDPSRLTVTVANGCDPGAAVTITASYPYDAWTMVPLSVTLASTSSGVIAY